MDVVGQRVVPGPSSAVDRAWREHGPAALRLAAALVGPSDAADITASAFGRVTRRPGWEHFENLRGYLLRSVRNEAHNLSRANGRRWARDLCAVSPDVHADQHADVDVLRALSRLSVRQRSVLFLAYWEDMTEADIAHVLGLARGTVHRDLKHARDQLRKELT